jgi:hypothetical protein
MDVSHTSTALRGGVALEALDLVAGCIPKISAEFWTCSLEFGYDGLERLLGRASSMVGEAQGYRAFGNFALASVILLGVLLVSYRFVKPPNAA